MFKNIMIGIIAYGISISTLAYQIIADDIITKARDRDDGKSFSSNVILTLKDKKGSIREREFLYLQKDFGDDDKFTISFLSPGDVRGVGFHIVNPHESKGAEDSQWMYLPVSRQVRRISTTDKRGSFMGSNYSYIDLDKLRVGDYTQEVIGTESVNGRECWLVRRIPASQDVINMSGYHRIDMWIDKKTFIVMRQDFYDIKGVNFKRTLTQEVQTVDEIDSIIVSSTEHLLNGTVSEMKFKNLKYNVNLDDSIFSQHILRKGINEKIIEKTN